MADAIADTMWEWFAKAHPHEAYTNDPERFWQFFQAECPGVSREQMEKTLQETEAAQ